jgi:hypothetical protein
MRSIAEKIGCAPETSQHWPRCAVFSLDEFHHESGEIGCLLESVDRGDVLMIERGEHFGLASKAKRSASPATNAGNTFIATDRFRLPSIVR